MTNATNSATRSGGRQVLLLAPVKQEPAQCSQVFLLAPGKPQRARRGSITRAWGWQAEDEWAQPTSSVSCLALQHSPEQDFKLLNYLLYYCAHAITTDKVRPGQDVKLLDPSSRARLNKPPLHMLGGGPGQTG